MRIVTLGTGAGRPTLRRSSSAVGLEFLGETFLFDCGEGTQLQLMKTSFRWGKVSTIFISHLHGDHVNGLPGLLGTLSLSDRENPITIYGPKGLKEFLDVHEKLQAMALRFEMTVKEITEPGVLLSGRHYQVSAQPLQHPVPCWGFRFEEKPRPGRFNGKKAEQEGIPSGPYRAALVQGDSITLADGRTFDSKDFVGPQRPGRIFVYCTDTRPCEEAIKLAQGADLFLYESTFSEEVKENAHRYGHSTAADGAKIAKEAKVQSLVLIHISQRYGEVDQLLAEASGIFTKVRIASDLEFFMINPRK